jgi:hypothetical protein
MAEHELFEPLALLLHVARGHALELLLAQGSPQADGTLLLPAQLAVELRRLTQTAYADLTPDEREPVDRIVQTALPTIDMWHGAHLTDEGDVLMAEFDAGWAVRQARRQQAAQPSEHTDIEG